MQHVVSLKLPASIETQFAKHFYCCFLVHQSEKSWGSNIFLTGQRTRQAIQTLNHEKTQTIGSKASLPSGPLYASVKIWIPLEDAPSTRLSFVYHNPVVKIRNSKPFDARTENARSRPVNSRPLNLEEHIQSRVRAIKRLLMDKLNRFDNKSKESYERTVIRKLLIPLGWRSFRYPIKMVAIRRAIRVITQQETIAIPYKPKHVYIKENPEPIMEVQVEKLLWWQIMRQIVMLLDWKLIQ